jgi:hypothetical protein
MTLVKAKAVTQRDWIYGGLDSNDYPQVIGCESLSTLLLKVDDRAIRRRAEAVCSGLRLFKQMWLEHEEYRLSRNWPALAFAILAARDGDLVCLRLVTPIGDYFCCTTIHF